MNFTLFLPSLWHKSIFLSMPKVNPKSLAELEAQKKAIREAAAAEVAAIRKATAAKVAALKSNERRLRAMDIKEQKRRENHAKILLGVALIHQAQTSEESSTKAKSLIESFYSNSPERLKSALYGLTLRVTKPSSDEEQD